MTESCLLNAKQVAEKPFNSYFDAWNLTLVLFLECFATRSLLWLLSRGTYAMLIQVPPLEIVTDRIERMFDCLPDEMSPEMLEDVAKLHAKLLMNWRIWMQQEKRIARGAFIIAMTAARAIQTLVIIAILGSSHSFWLLGFLVFATCLSAFVCLRNTA